MDGNIGKKLGAEFIGTFLLVLGGCGSAIFAASALGTTKDVVGIGGAALPVAGVVNHGIGYLGVALAFGLTVVCGAYGLGHVSGGHFNPAVSIGLATAKRFEWKDVPAYIVTQCIASIAAVGVLWAIQAGRPGGFTIGQGSFASNAYGQENGRIFYDLPAAFIAEVVLTALFLVVILGVTTKAASKAQAALGIGLMLTLIHLISIPITNTSVNPARSLGPALFERGTALGQLWLFIVAPIIGGVLGAVAWKLATGGDDAQTGESEAEGVEAT
ncbi:MAG TPA: MIP family channel protein [Microthrixaceae bacterium]|nr:MIP family channel protein [Microthrixaceae bacterium]